MQQQVPASVYLTFEVLRWVFRLFSSSLRLLLSKLYFSPLSPLSSTLIRLSASRSFNRETSWDIHQRSHCTYLISFFAEIPSTLVRFSLCSSNSYEIQHSSFSRLTLPSHPPFLCYFLCELFISLYSFESKLRVFQVSLNLLILLSRLRDLLEENLLVFW